MEKKYNTHRHDKQLWKSSNEPRKTGKIYTEGREDLCKTGEGDSVPKCEKNPKQEKRAPQKRKKIM